MLPFALSPAKKRSFVVGLVDLAPRTETVGVQGNAVTVFGISAKGLANLLRRFPELRMLMTGQEVQVDRLMAMSGDRSAPSLL